jgi:hypothetical protein
MSERSTPTKERPIGRATASGRSGPRAFGDRLPTGIDERHSQQLASRLAPPLAARPLSPGTVVVAPLLQGPEDKYEIAASLGGVVAAAPSRSRFRAVSLPVLTPRACWNSENRVSPRAPLGSQAMFSARPGPPVPAQPSKRDQGEDPRGQHP